MMRPLIDSAYGNPSSGHWAGKPARGTVERARTQVAGLLGCTDDEVVFTSGGSEANNLFLKGAAATLKPGLLAVSAVEHPCILKPAAQLATTHRLA